MGRVVPIMDGVLLGIRTWQCTIILTLRTSRGHGAPPGDLHVKIRRGRSRSRSPTAVQIQITSGREDLWQNRAGQRLEDRLGQRGF